jgi:parallel beta-helix repeat protein
MDRAHIDVLEMSEARRARNARRAVLVAICITAVLSLSALSIPFLVRPGETPRKAIVSYTVHSPIVIMDDSEFTSANGVTGGSGTASDPYIIEGWEIDATSGMYGVAIMVTGTTAHYVIRGVHASGSGAICIDLEAAPHGIVENCIVESAMIGIAVMNSQDVNITGCTVLSMDLAGIALLYSEMVNISGDILTGGADMVGIIVGDADHINITDIEVNDSYGGIILADADNVTVTDSVASNSTGLGLGVDGGNNLMIMGCNFSANLYAGVFLNDTRNVTVENNSITMNQRWGVYLDNASDAKVFHNRFIGNPEQAVQGPNVTASVWDDGYPSGGNYWSDYTGIDADGDGIGDTPYTFPQGAEDRYPFMNEDLQFVPEFGMIVYPVLGMLTLFGAAAYRRRTEKD